MTECVVVNVMHEKLRCCDSCGAITTACRHFFRECPTWEVGNAASGAIADKRFWPRLSGTSHFRKLPQIVKLPVLVLDSPAEWLQPLTEDGSCYRWFWVSQDATPKKKCPSKVALMGIWNLKGSRQAEGRVDSK